MSDSVRPHRRQPTRLPRPWDSPGKNTGVGCHFLLQCMKVKSESKSLSRVRLLATPWTAAYQAPPSIGFSRQEYWSGVPLPSPYYLLSLIKFMICKYFLPFHRLSFHFLIISFDSQKFNFDKPNLTFLAHVFGITPKVMKVYCYVFF